MRPTIETTGVKLNFLNIFKTGFLHFASLLPSLFLLILSYLIFTESAPWPIQSISRNVRVFICYCHHLETTLSGGLESSGLMGYC